MSTRLVVVVLAKSQLIPWGCVRRVKLGRCQPGSLRRASRWIGQDSCRCNARPSPPGTIIHHCRLRRLGLSFFVRKHISGLGDRGSIKGADLGAVDEDGLVHRPAHRPVLPAVELKLDVTIPAEPLLRAVLADGALQCPVPSPFRTSADGRLMTSAGSIRKGGKTKSRAEPFFLFGCAQAVEETTRSQRRRSDC